MKNALSTSKLATATVPQGLVALLACMIVLHADHIRADYAQTRPSRLQVKLRPNEPDGNSDYSTATATCAVQMARRQAVLHFQAQAFSHQHDPSLRSDVFLKAIATHQHGPIYVSPRRQADRSRLAKEKGSAAVSIGFSGTGSAKLRLEVQIDTARAIAGRHETTVVMTVTGR